MVTRRRVLGLGCACSAAAIAGISPWAAVAQDDWSFCSTVDHTTPAGTPEPSVGSVLSSVEIEHTSGAPAPFSITNHGLSMAGKRWRKSDGRTPGTGIITLGVHFLNGSATDHALVERGARAWLTNGIEKLIDFQFGVPQARAEISIAFDQGVNDSKIGRDSLNAARSGYSMRIHQRAEYIVTHEFGHALCLKHEHQHPASGIVWNKERVYADLAAQGITDRAVIKRNIFDPLSADLICATSPNFDAASIMSYQIPASWTLNGFSSRIPDHLSDGDVACVLGIYGG